MIGPCKFPLMGKVYRTNYRDVVSSVQVKINRTADLIIVTVDSTEEVARTGGQFWRDWNWKRFCQFIFGSLNKSLFNQHGRPTTNHAAYATGGRKNQDFPYLLWAEWCNTIASRGICNISVGVKSKRKHYFLHRLSAWGTRAEKVFVWKLVDPRQSVGFRGAAEEATQTIGRIRLSVSTVNHTYELSGITHVTSFCKYGKHSTGPSTYRPWVRTYGKLFSCKSVLTVSNYRAQSNEIHTYGRVSRGSLPRVRR